MRWWLHVFLTYYVLVSAANLVSTEEADEPETSSDDLSNSTSVSEASVAARMLQMAPEPSSNDCGSAPSNPPPYLGEMITKVVEHLLSPKNKALLKSFEPCSCELPTISQEPSDLLLPESLRLNSNPKPPNESNLQLPQKMIPMLNDKDLFESHEHFNTQNLQLIKSQKEIRTPIKTFELPSSVGGGNGENHGITFPQIPIDPQQSNPTQTQTKPASLNFSKIPSPQGGMQPATAIGQLPGFMGNLPLPGNKIYPKPTEDNGMDMNVPGGGSEEEGGGMHMSPNGQMDYLQNQRPMGGARASSNYYTLKGPRGGGGGGGGGLDHFNFHSQDYPDFMTYGRYPLGGMDLSKYYYGFKKPLRHNYDYLPPILKKYNYLEPNYDDDNDYLFDRTKLISKILPDEEDESIEKRKKRSTMSS